MVPGQESALIVPKASTEPGAAQPAGHMTEAEFDAVCRKYFVDMAQVAGVTFGEQTKDTLPAEGDEPERWRASAMCSSI